MFGGGNRMSNASEALADIQNAIDNRPPNWRAGQAAFNRLYEVAPGWADHIRGGPLDPFHLDERLPTFFAWLPSVIVPGESE